jgi:hypothetical protein
MSLLISLGLGGLPAIGCDILIDFLFYEFLFATSLTKLFQMSKFDNIAILYRTGQPGYRAIKQA